MIDQRLLPSEVVWRSYRRAGEVAEAIRAMVVRGAPAIGIAACYGLALEAINDPEFSLDPGGSLRRSALILERTRPTAVNLKWAIDRMLARYHELADSTVAEIQDGLRAEAERVALEDEKMCRLIGEHGAKLLNEGARVLTHCNAGALATADYGTALGVIRAAREKITKVWVDETRPFLQGARLTAWELMQEGIPCTLICDNMAAHFMQQGLVDAVIVGADRITSLGAVANKIGTYNLAILCKFHEIPFYVAAPYSTIDLKLKHGSEIPIEERPSTEVTHVQGLPIAPAGVAVANPAFDVTPPELISAIITERGVLKGQFAEGLSSVVARALEVRA